MTFLRNTIVLGIGALISGLLVAQMVFGWVWDMVMCKKKRDEPKIYPKHLFSRPGMRHAFVQTHDARLHVVSMGPTDKDAPLVVLVHGFPGSL